MTKDEIVDALRKASVALQQVDCYAAGDVEDTLRLIALDIEEGMIGVSGAEGGAV